MATTVNAPAPGQVFGFAEFGRFHPQHQGINTKDGIARSILFDLTKRGSYPDRWIRENETLDFTGQGLPEKGDQKWDTWNRGMRRAMEEQAPIRVFERISHKPSSFKFHGTWYVTGLKEAIVPSTQQRVFRFTVSSDPEPAKLVVGIPNLDVEHIACDVLEPPARVQATTNRIIRDTKLSRELKRLYRHACQIRGATQQVSERRGYAEAHHIRPLGRPHDGPDSRDNVVVLCARHHVDFDFGAVAIDPSDGETIHHKFDQSIDGAKLTFRKGHKLSRVLLLYHWECIYNGGPLEGGADFNQSALP